MNTHDDIKPGQRVCVEGYTHGDGTFLRYDTPHSGVRIAVIDFDRYGEHPVWMHRITATRPPLAAPDEKLKDDVREALDAIGFTWPQPRLLELAAAEAVRLGAQYELAPTEMIGEAINTTLDENPSLGVDMHGPGAGTLDGGPGAVTP